MTNVVLASLVDEPSLSETPGDSSAAHFARELIHARQTVLPKRLVDPGPSSEQLHQICLSASAAPDHGKLMPWRFVLIPASARQRLAQVFKEALLSRDPQATPEQVEQAAEKAYRAPTLILAIAKTTGGDMSIDGYERMVSIGCAIQNMLLTATAMGFGSALTSGKALRSSELSALFSLESGEVAVCFLSVGTVSSRKQVRARPEVHDYLTTLGAS